MFSVSVPWWTPTNEAGVGEDGAAREIAALEFRGALLGETFNKATWWMTAGDVCRLGTVDDVGRRKANVTVVGFWLR